MAEKPDTRQQIVATAFELFRSKGYEKVTVNEICEACSLSKNTFYYYFRSKDDLLLDMYSGLSDFSLSRMSEIFSAKSYLRQLWMLDEPLLDFSLHAGAPLMRHWWVCAMSRGLTQNAGPHPMQAEIISAASGIVQKAQQAGEMLNQMDALLLVRAKTRLMLGTIVEWALRDGAFDLKADLASHLDTLYDAAPAFSLARDYGQAG